MVMKHTQFLDAIRNIKKQWVSFLSIVLIVMLGVMAYLGINYSAAAMKTGGQNFYESTNFKDVEMVATLLMSDKDLDKIKDVKGVGEVEGVYQTSGRINNTDVTIETVTEKVSVPILVKGEMPKTAQECVLEEKLAKICNVNVGDKILILNSVGENAKYLLYNEFTVTGLVHHPDHVTVKLPENLYVLVTEDAFDVEELDHHFMKAEIVLDAAEGKSTFSTEYFDAIESTETELRSLSEERASARDDEIRENGMADLAELQAQLEAAKLELDNARAELDAKTVELEDAKTELDKAWSQLESAKSELETAKATLDNARTQLDSAATELLTKYNEIVAAKNTVRSLVKQTVAENAPDLEFEWAGDDSEAESISDPAVVASQLQLTSDTAIDLGSNLDSNIHTILASRGISEEQVNEYENAILSSADYATVESSYNELMNAVNAWDSAHAEYLSKEGEYSQGLAKYNSGKSEYDTNLALYNTKKAEYDEAVLLLEEKEREYNDKYAEYENGMAQMLEGKQQLANMEDCKWFQFNRKANAGYVDLNMVASNLASLGMTFSLLFILVGAMVCYATIGRMVDEQRTLVGATKALGFFDGEIFAKYLMFGVTSTAIGIALGVLAAYFGLQKAILVGYANMYVIGEADKVIIPLSTIIVVVCGLALSVVAIFLATTKLLKMTAIALMKEETPRTKAKQGKGKNGGSLYAQLIVANIVTDLRRVAVTVVSVAGCCALLVIGFTLKFSVDGVMDIQYGEIVKYDKNLNFNPESSGNTEEDIEKILKEDKLDYYEIFDTYVTYQITDVMEIGELLVVDDSKINDFYELDDINTGKKIKVKGDGIYIQKRLAETYNLKKGDKLKIYDNNAKEHTIKVSGVFNNYTGRTMVMKTTFYEKVFGDKAKKNRYLVKMGDYNENSLRSELKSVKGFTTLSRADTARALFASISTILNALIIGLIFMAGMMAVFVLLNLANMYVLQKERELTIMRINGFTLKEVKSYVLLETYITTFIGILIGFGGGAALAYKIIRSLEQPHIQLIRQVSLLGWLISGVMTAVISFIIYQIAVRRVKHLELTV